MSYDLYRYIFIGGLVLSVLMLVLAVVMFFTMDIRRLIGEYNGTTKRKAIEKIRKKSSGEATTSGDISKYAPKPASVKSKPAPVKSKAPSKNSKPSENYVAAETSKIKPQDRYDSFDAPETTTLSDYTAQQSIPEAEVQYSAEQVQYPYVYREDFIIETDITYVHSSEVIR